MECRASAARSGKRQRESTLVREVSGVQLAEHPAEVTVSLRRVLENKAPGGAMGVATRTPRRAGQISAGACHLWLPSGAHRMGPSYSSTSSLPLPCVSEATSAACCLCSFGTLRFSPRSGSAPATPRVCPVQFLPLCPTRGGRKEQGNGVSTLASVFMS